MLFSLQRGTYKPLFNKNYKTENNGDFFAADYFYFIFSKKIINLGMFWQKLQTKRLVTTFFWCVEEMPQKPCSLIHSTPPKNQQLKHG